MFDPHIGLLDKLILVSLCFFVEVEFIMSGNIENHRVELDLICVDNIFI